MKHIKKFNESIVGNPLDYLKDEILDILQDSFLDNDIPVDVVLSSAEVKDNSIESRQPIYVNIGNRQLDFSKFISLKDKWGDLKRLINWADSENLILKKFKIHNVLINSPTEYHKKQMQIDVDVDKWDGITNLYLTAPERYTEKYGSINIKFENLGWQTSYKKIYGFSYAAPITNEIIQEYKFTDMNQMTNFISSSMKVFEGQNHHPHYFNWSGNKLFISLKTHSSDSITQKDLDVASKIDKLYYDIFKKI
jgi:pterin-4a-carbinolamine dehydratase